MLEKCLRRWRRGVRRRTFPGARVNAFYSAMTGPYLCTLEWSSIAILFPSKPFQRVYRRCVAILSFPPRGFPSQIGWPPIHRLMRRRTSCALSRGLVPGGPVTSLPAFYLCLWGTNDDHVDPNITCSRAIHKPPHQQHRRDFSFQNSYSGVYEAAVIAAMTGFLHGFTWRLRGDQWKIK